MCYSCFTIRQKIVSYTTTSPVATLESIVSRIQFNHVEEYKPAPAL